MINYCIKRSYLTQRGSVSVLVLMLVVMACTLSLGILALSETNAHTRFMQHAVQSTANAAAFTYGREYVTNVKLCIKDKILDMSEVVELASDSECKMSELVACAESDFKTCDIDINACFEKDESPILSCQNDQDVISKSENSATQKARSIASKYELHQVSIRRQNQKYVVNGQADLSSTIPEFGQNKTDSYTAESNIIIFKK